ncbi:MAG: ribosome biogenesis GTP-binding protein YihA/YsxC [Rhodospirillaceae bacterium]|nr:ribosome biogenesis GTP-binding protein YihA/YsxC [Rhodospirillaceae bacterium]MDE0616120.1 ribosome biogenesis GTP-binding protein YihA/YsxC [Rhodospirillaceae bacterium]
MADAVSHPEAEDAEASALEAGRLLFAQQCSFVAGVVRVAGLPPDALPEVAFAGRSNVGKSSLINALTGRKALARTSNTPGRTQQVNFFDLGGRLYLVDLPGYGYARASKDKVRRWNALIRDYLRGRAGLRRVCLLIDARRGLTPGDREIMELLDISAVSYQIVLTKSDKLHESELAACLAETARAAARHPACHPDIAATSAEKDRGIAELRAALATVALPA